MPAVRSSLVHPAYKTEYRVRNWREYEQGLRARGDVTIWFSEEATANWISRSAGARGGPRLYSDLAIETSLTLRTVFGLPLRQAEGFLGSLLSMLGLDQLPVPDHSTLSRRAQSLDVAPKATQHRGPIHGSIRLIRCPFPLLKINVATMSTTCSAPHPILKNTGQALSA